MQAEVASVPNATPINEWAERVTNGLIPQVVSPSLNFNMVRTPSDRDVEEYGMSGPILLNTPAL